MKMIYIEVKDNYVSNVLKMLEGIKEVMIDKIKLEPLNKEDKTDDDLIALQTSSMEKTWENDEDKAWDAL